jgi:hypothetical protein
MTFPNNLITADNRMRDGVLDEDDRKLIEEAELAASCEAAAEDLPMGSVEINAESMVEISDAAMKVFTSACDSLSKMTPEQAILIRCWRVELRWTWRMIARNIHCLGWFREFSPPSNQLVGMAVCLRAATKFGEDYMRGVWN